MTTKNLPIGAQFRAHRGAVTLTVVSSDTKENKVVVEFQANGTCKEEFQLDGLLTLLERGGYEFVLDEFTKHYLVAALWSSTDDEGENLDENYDLNDLSVGALIDSIEDCVAFQKDNETLLAAYYQLIDRRGHEDSPQAFAGHDFWLTRNGHGCGFWDRGLGKLGDALSDASKTYGGVDITVGSDDKLHI